jgi:hypothetical protein
VRRDELVESDKLANSYNINSISRIKPSRLSRDSDEAKYKLMAQR